MCFQEERHTEILRSPNSSSRIWFPHNAMRTKVEDMNSTALGKKRKKEMLPMLCLLGPLFFLVLIPGFFSLHAYSMFSGNLQPKVWFCVNTKFVVPVAFMHLCARAHSVCGEGEIKGETGRGR